MSNSVDNRVVQMEFDNKQFEKGVKTTLGSLDKLNKSLKLEDSSKGLNELQKTANKFNLNAVSQAADQVGVRFTAMQVVAFRALQNITDAAMRAGKKIVSALTVQMPKEGFGKYEQKVEAVQTIMYATGKKIEEVNDVLNKLMKYTDETSYSFSDMTTSISKFTSAGIDLSVAEDAMEGIANWAATAGVGPQKAASAFYNLTQAMSAGSMKSIDWKSISLLNMNTQQFKQTVLDTTNEMIKNGEITKENIEAFKKANVTVQNFDTSLSNGWFSKDIMLKVFAKYADQTTDFGEAAYHAAQEAKTFSDAIGAIKDAIGSGWMQTWEYIFGDYTKAKEFWTNLTNTVLEFTDRFTSARNAVFEFWNEFSGREKLIRALKQMWQNLIRVINPVIEAFEKVFSPKDGFLTQSRFVQKHIKRIFELKGIDYNKFGDFLLLLTDRFERLSKKLIPTEHRIDQLRRIFEGLFSAIHIVWTVISSLVRAFRDVLGGEVKEAGDSIVEATASVGDFVTKLDESLTKSDSVYNTFKRVFEFIKKIVDGAKEALNKAKDAFEEFTGIDLHIPTFEEFSDALKRIHDKLDPVITALKNGAVAAWDFVKPFASKAWKTLTSVVKVIAGILVSIVGAIGPAAKKISEFFKSLFRGEKNISDIKTSFRGWIDTLKELFKNYLSRFDGTPLGDFLKNIPKWVDNAKTALSNLVTNIKDRLSDITPGQLLAAGVAIVAIPTLLSIKNAFDLIGGLADVIGGIGRAMKGFFKSITRGIKYTAILKIALAIALLAGSIFLLSQIKDMDRLKTCALIIGILTVVVGGFAVALTALSSAVDPKKIGVMATLLVSLSGSMLLIAASIRALDNMDQTNLVQKLALLLTITTFMAAIVIVMSHLSGGKTAKGALFVAAFALVIYMMTKALKVILEFPIEKAKAALPAIAGIFLSMAVLAAAMGGVKFGGAIGLFAMVAALWLFIVTMDKYADSPIVQKIKKKIEGFIDKIKEIIEKIKTGFSKVIETAKLLVSDSEEGKELRDRLSNALSSSGGLLGLLSVIGMALGAGSLLAGMGGGLKAVLGIAAVVGGLFAIFYLIKQMIDFIDGNDITAKNIEMIGNLISKISLALGAASALAGLKIKGAGWKASTGGGGFNILAMAAGLWLLFLLIKNIIKADLDPGAVERLSNTLMKVAIVFGVAVAIAGIAGSAIRAITAMTIAVSVMMIILTIMSLLTEEQLNKVQHAAIIMGAIMLALSLSLLIASGTKVKEIFGIISMIAAIVVIAKSMAILAQFDWVSILAAAIALSAVMLVMGIVMGLAGIGGGGAAIGAGAGMLLFSVGIIAVALALSMLAQVPIDNLAAALVGLGVSLAIIAVFGGIFGLLSGVFLTGAVVLIVFSVAIAALGAALAIFSVGFEEFVNKIGPIGQKIVEAFQPVVEWFGKLKDSVMGLVEKVSDSKLVGFFRSLFNIDTSGFVDGAKEAQASLESVGEAAEEAAKEARNAADEIQNANDEANRAANNASVNNGRRYRPDNNAYRVQSQPEEIQFELKPVIEPPDSAQRWEIVSQTQELMEQVKNDVAMGSKTEDKMPMKWDDLIKFPGIEEITGLGEESGSSYIQGITNGLSLGDNGGFLESLKSLFSSGNDEARSAGEEAQSSYIEGYGSNSQEGIISVVQNQLASISAQGPEFFTAGEDNLKEFINGFLEDDSAPVSAGEEVGAAAVVGLNNLQPGAQQTGVNFVMGFVNGMNGLRDLLYNVAYNIGYQALSAAKTAIHEGSPSIEMMKVGKHFVEGFIIGIDNMNDKSNATAANLGISAIKSIESMLDTIEEKMNSEIIYEPTIRPVLDLTNIESGAGMINTLLNSDPAFARSAIGYANQTQNGMQRLFAENEFLRENQNGSKPVININVTTQELSNSTVDYLVRRVNSALGGKI